MGPPMSEVWSVLGTCHSRLPTRNPAALHVSEYTVERELDVAHTLATRYPNTRDAAGRARLRHSRSAAAPCKGGVRRGGRGRASSSYRNHSSHRRATQATGGLHPVSVLAGYGPISTRIATEMLEAARDVYRVDLDRTGQSLQIERYTPTKRMRRLIEARDQHCCFTGCTRVPLGCDIDHTLAWQDGEATIKFDRQPIPRKSPERATMLGAGRDFQARGDSSARIRGAPLRATNALRGLAARSLRPLIAISRSEQTG